MNTAQMNTDPKTGDNMMESEWQNVTHHGYNLRPRPTRASSK